MAIIKKSPQLHHTHEKSGLKKFFIVILVISLAVFVLGGAWFLSKLGPKKVDYRDLQSGFEVSEEAKALQQESIEYEAQFEQILAIRKAEAADLEILKKALDAQKSYTKMLNGVDADGAKRERLLQKRYEDLAAEPIREESLELEFKAEALATAKDYDTARAKYIEAYQMQKSINDQYPLSSSYNVGRATQLQRQARYLSAEPLLQQSLEFERKGDAFIEAKDWVQAEEQLKEAIELQDQLNRDYRGTNQSSVARLERLRVKLVGIRSGQSYLEILNVAELADAKKAAGENLEAANLYEGAARLQRKMNDTYPESPYASSELISEYQRKAQTALSVELGAEIEHNSDLLQDLLAERRTFEAADVIATLRRDIKQMEDAYPRSSLNDEALQLKIRYLNLVQSDLGFIQDRVYAALLPIPEEGSWQMLRTEVPQALYSLIMGTNPSRNQGDVNPVDSVSWSESKMFCERLSWIMGKPVRLPKENEFRKALGRLRYVVLEDHVWSVSNASGVPRGVGEKDPFASGFYDLLGNVSEWLESADRFEAEDARHIGGHAQDRLESIFTVPIREAPRGERNRLTGFRFVIQVD